jgi:hypothetical protein
MFEVYLSDRCDLLVIEKGSQVPLVAASGKWRKRKTKVVRVSDEIRSAVQRQGYYLRKLRDQKNHGQAHEGLAPRFSHVQPLFDHH